MCRACSHGFAAASPSAGLPSSLHSWWGLSPYLFLTSVLDVVWCRLLRVAVQAAEEEVAEEGEQHGGEPCHEQPRRPTSDPTAGHPGVQVGAVDEPGEKRCRLLGVPAPVGAPCDLRPDGAENDDQGEQWEADDDCAVSQLVQY